MNTSNITLDAQTLMQSIELSVRVTRRFRFRFWLGSKLIVAGAKMLGCNVDVEVIPEPEA